MTRTRSTALLAALTLLLAACAGYTSYQEGRALATQGDLMGGIAKMEKAVREAPKNVQYRQDLERLRGFAAARYVSEGDIARSADDPVRAQAAYRNALALEPGNKLAQDGLNAIDQALGFDYQLRQARVDLEQGNLDGAELQLKEVLRRKPEQREARDLLNQISAQRAEAQAKAPASQLKSPFTKPITLEFRDATLKSVFEVISRSSGINFVFDRDVRADTRINIFVRNTSLDDVIKLILVTNQLERKLLNENSVLIYPNTPAKQKEYRELVVRSFYLANADVKQALNLVKGMVKSQDVFIDEKLNMIVVKDTPEALRVVSQLMRTLDLAEPEVVLEMEVLELAASKLQELGIRYPERINLGVPPTASTGGNGGNGGNGGTTGNAVVDFFVLGTDTLKGFIANPPIVIDLRAQDSTAKVLANPRVRVKNREKAKVHIGSRVPVVTTTSTANVGVSSSVSYLDVGLKLDVEPNIYLRDDVAIKLNLEVSNIIRTVQLTDGGIAYELGTRNSSTVLQLKDGETQILAGLISDEDRRTTSKVPGLGDFPTLGALFRSDSDDRRKTEIVMLITPRVVRSLDFPRVANSELAIGTDAAIGQSPLRIAPTPPGTVQVAPAGPGGGQPAAISRPLPSEAVPVPVPVPLPLDSADDARGQPPPGGEGESGEPPPENVAAAASTGIAQLMMAGPLAARSGSEIVVSLTMAPGGPTNKATAEVSYDALQLEPAGVPISSPGRIPVRIEGATTLRFRVVSSAGRAQIRVDNIVGVDATGSSIVVNPPAPLDITISP